MQIAIYVYDAAGAVDDQLVLDRPHVPRKIHVAGSPIALDRPMPFVEGQIRVPAGCDMAYVHSLDGAEKGLHQRQPVDTDIEKRIPAFPVVSRHRSARVGRIIRASQKVDGQNVAAGALPHQTERLQHHRVKACGVAD